MPEGGRDPTCLLSTTRLCPPLSTRSLFCPGPGFGTQRHGSTRIYTCIGSLKAGFVTERSAAGSCRAFRVQYPILIGIRTQWH
jgi:hypothetical protein